MLRAISSVGRAPRLHRGCREFESLIAHHLTCRIVTGRFTGKAIDVRGLARLTDDWADQVAASIDPVSIQNPSNWTLKRGVDG